MIKFIGREKEMEILEHEFSKNTASMIVIYGRRRVGKTRLIEEFVKNKKFFYYLAADEKEELQIREFKEGIANFLQDEALTQIEIRDWKVLFSYLQKIWPVNEKLVLVIDEFTYMIKQNPSIVSYLQRFWDRFLSKTATKLILCGSLVGLMIKNVLEESSPLYGRRTAEIFLEKFGIKEVMEFLDVDIENAIKFYSVLDGIPKYLELVDTRDFEEFLFRVLDKRSFFYREGYYLMTEELKQIPTYMNILRAIGDGNTKIAEISNFTGIEAKKLYPYLEILENTGFVKRKEPLLGKKRQSIFLIEDNFLDFWFRFIHKYRAYIELDRVVEIRQKILSEINSFVGRKFEKVCEDFVRKKFNFLNVGRQWGKIPKEFKPERGRDTYEIDIVALNEKTKEILLAECKWQNRVNARKICKELAEKSQYVQWHNDKRKEGFAIFAKSFSKRINEFEGRKVYCFDLRDMEKVIKNHHDNMKTLLL